MNTESVWRGIVLAWSLMSAAGASLTFIMFRAALADQRQIAASAAGDEISLLGRRGVRGVGSRLIACSTFVLASGTLWTVPDPARRLADIAVRLGFGMIFAICALALLIIAVHDLLDTLHLVQGKPVAPGAEQPTTPEVTAL